MRAARMLTRATRRRPRPKPRPVPAGVDRGLLADVGNLAGAAAVTINRLHRRGLDDIARPLEEALGRLGRTR